MKAAALAALIIFLMLAVVIIALEIMTPSLNFHYKFTSGADPTFAEQRTKGWIPEWLPADVYDIEHAHELDSNISLISFRIRNEDEATFLTSCTQCADCTSYIPPALPKMRNWITREMRKGAKGRILICPETRRQGHRWLVLRDSDQYFIWNDISPASS